MKDAAKNEILVEILIMIFLITFINIAILNMGITFDIHYSNKEVISTASIYWANNENDGFSEKNKMESKIHNGKAKLTAWEKISEQAQYRIDFINDSVNIGITGLRLYYGFIPLIYINGKDLFNQISTYGNIENLEVREKILYITPINNDPVIYFNSDFNLMIKNQTQKGYIIFCLFIDILLIICVILIVKHNDLIVKYISLYEVKYSKQIIIIFKIILCCTILTSIGLVIFLSLYSNFDTHPDEKVTKSAVDYYLVNWIPPDIRDDSIADTFSAYGHSRLAELNIYYFLAGKFGYIFKTLFHCNNYYRIFNILIYIIMCVIIIKNIWKESWLAICIISTPQLCYIFSYATSDAWDYFCSFVLIYQITVQNSMTNRAFEEERNIKKYFTLAAFGIFSAFIFMGKQNYYVVLLLAFIIFLFKLIKAEPIYRKKLINNYIFIVMVFSIAFMIRYSFNVCYYGMNQAEISMQVKEIRAEYKFKNSTPLDERFSGLALKDSGISIFQLLYKYNFLETSFKSFCGVYGYMQYYGKPSYYHILETTYKMLLMLLFLNFFNIGKLLNKLEYICVTLVVFLSIILSVYHSWTGDFQPQGRYLLPMLIGIGYLTSKIKNKSIETIYLVFISSIALTGIYGFYEYGILQLI